MQSLFQLFWIFFRIGAFTFGGGYVMLPIIQHELSEKYHIIEEKELSELLVLSQSLPGIMAVNAATAVGYKLYGKRGAVICAVGVALPSFLIIVLLAGLLLRYQDNAHLQGALQWVRAVVVGMIAAAAFKMGKPCLHNKMQLGMVLAALFFAIVSVHPAVLILAGALAGWALTKEERGGDPS